MLKSAHQYLYSRSPTFALSIADSGTTTFDDYAAAVAVHQGGTVPFDETLFKESAKHGLAIPPTRLPEDWHR